MNNLELKVEKNIEESVGKEIVETGKLTDEKIEKTLNYDLLTKEEQKAIDEFNKKIDISKNYSSGKDLQIKKCNNTILFFWN